MKTRVHFFTVQLSVKERPKIHGAKNKLGT